MFTGLIEALGTVSEVAPSPAGSRIVVQTSLGAALVPGDSLAVNGACLTVVSGDAGSASMDVSPQTARVTTLGAIKAGTVLNLERSLSAGARLGGPGMVPPTGIEPVSHA